MEGNRAAETLIVYVGYGDNKLNENELIQIHTHALHSPFHKFKVMMLFLGFFSFMSFGLVQTSLVVPFLVLTYQS